MNKLLINHKCLWLIIPLSIFSLGTLYGQQKYDSVSEPEIYDTAYYDDEETWIEPDTIFNNVKGLAFPADSFTSRHIPPAIIDSIKNDEAFWYAKFVKKAEKEKQKNENANLSFLNKLIGQQWFKTLVWIVIILGFLAVMIWYLAYSNISFFRPAAKPIAMDDDFIPLNIFDINYDREIDKAMHDENFRLVIRLMFLQLLKKMDEHDIINYQQDFTNYDYRMQLHGTHYEPPFKKLVKYYEYTWYGKWQPDKAIFRQVKEQFEAFNGQLNK